MLSPEDEIKMLRDINSDLCNRAIVANELIKSMKNRHILIESKVAKLEEMVKTRNFLISILVGSVICVGLYYEPTIEQWFRERLFIYVR